MYLLSSLFLGFLGTLICAGMGTILGLGFGNPTAGAYMGVAGWFLSGLVKSVGLIIYLLMCNKNDKDCLEYKWAWEDFRIFSELFLGNVLSGPYLILPIIT